MPVTAQNLVDEFAETYKDGGTDATVLRLLQRTLADILKIVPLRKSTQYIALTKGVRSYPADVSWIRFWRVRYYLTTGNKNVPETFVTTEDTDNPDWIDNGEGDPASYMLDANETKGVILLSHLAAYTTLTVTAATNASPIVITTQTHGLTDKDSVVIKGVLGNVAANGTFFVDVLTPTTFALYSDEALTVPVAGTGVYTSGGMIATGSSAFLEVEVTLEPTLALASNMPDLPTPGNLYLLGMFRYHAEKQHRGDYMGTASAPGYKLLYDDALSNLNREHILRGGRKQPEIRMFKQRVGRSVVRTNW